MEDKETYVKVRTTLYPNGEQTRYRVRTIDADKLDEDVIDERFMYGHQPRIQSVDDAAGSVVAVFEDGTVRITHYR